MIPWSIMTALVGCSITFYLFIRYVLLLHLSPVATGILLIMFLIMGCFPLLAYYSFEQFLGKYYPLWRYTMYFVFIGCVILMVLTMALDISGFIAYKAGWLTTPPFSHGFALRFNLITIIAALLITVYSLYEGMKVPAVKEVSIASEKITADKKIVLLSDIHIHRVINPDKVRKIVEHTNALEPDIILLAGDIIDDDMSRISDTAYLLKELKAKGGIYFVSGNHEFYAGYRDSLVTMKKLGFKTVENSGVDLGDIFVAGIPDWRTAYRIGLIVAPETAFARAKPEQFRILLSHTPFDTGAGELFDLVVSGHTHGGQIFPFHILSVLSNKYLSGLYTLDNGGQIYVSRGAGQWGPQMRFLAPSEITLINLTSKNKEK